MECPRVVRPAGPAQCHADLFCQLEVVLEPLLPRSFPNPVTQPQAPPVSTPSRSWAGDTHTFTQVQEGGHDGRHPTTLMPPPFPPVDHHTRRQLDEFEEVISRMESMSGTSRPSSPTMKQPPPYQHHTQQQNTQHQHDTHQHHFNTQHQHQHPHQHSMEH
ncbi:hypothetical protein OTU49_016050, partial [Cherax quadricarinatus]